MKLFKNKGRTSEKAAKLDGVGIKDFAASLKPLLNKREYLTTMWPLAGYFIIWLALTGMGLYFAYSLLASLSMSIMMIMYGMMTITSLLFAVGEFLLLLVAVVVIFFLFYCLQVGVQFGYQDRIQNSAKVLSASSIWNRFKHLRKNQLLRLVAYSALFIFLWQLPLRILAGFFAGNAIVVNTLDVLNEIIAIWKGLQYSQALYLYRAKQPAFLGQSMRHALTVSKRYMAGFKFNYFLISLLFAGVPSLVWGGLTGGLIFYGVYTATNPCIWIGAVLLVLGFAAMMPYLTMIAPLYFEKTRTKVQVDAFYTDVFTPVAELTGEAYQD